MTRHTWFQRPRGMRATIVGLVLLLPSVVFAEPTPPDRFLTWQHSGLGIDGFWIYWAPESENPPQYRDDRRVQVPGAAVRTIAIVDVNSAATPGQGRLLFAITAYDATGNESAFAFGDRPGWFGVEAATAVIVRDKLP